jgi:hypothetical protein
MSELVNYAVSAGLDKQWVSDLVSRYGEELLQVVVQALQAGLTPDLIVRIVQDFGKLGLEVYMHMKLASVKMGASAGDPLVPAEMSVTPDAMLLKGLLKMLLTSYRPQIKELLVSEIDVALNYADSKLS